MSTQPKPWGRQGPPVGTIVVSHYAARWTGRVLFFGQGWVEVRPDDSVYEFGIDVRPPWAHERGYIARPGCLLFCLPSHGGAIVRLLLDRHMRPVRRRMLKTLDASWLEPTCQA